MSASIFRHTISNAIKKNLVPGIVLQSFAVIIGLCYFYVPSCQPYFSLLATLKYDLGSVYAFFATALFGGLIPFIYLMTTKQFANREDFIKLFLFYFLFWGVKGVEVDLFYQLQGYWFGYQNDFMTIATKTSVDQFIYSALWAAPSIAIAYLWMEHGFSIKDTRLALNRTFLTLTLPATILSNWLVWIPAVSIVYLMPADLQIPLFNLVLCFWVLMLAVLNKKADTDVPASVLTEKTSNK
ncbi:hypothetical protein [Catenovulum sediminis]|uniref:Carotenoid biosynthesis protein n=1 Tax=Catenovulum sediminis TaxID=1740262 RepID=A0ABV1RBY3_9ALTE